MKTLLRTLFGLALAAGLAGALPAAADELAIPLSHPGQPVVLVASGLQAQFTVEGYDGQQVLIDFTSEDGDEKEARHEAPPGMRRLSGAGSGLEAEEEDNRVRVSVDGQNEQHVRIRVPKMTSVHVSGVNGDDIVVRGVTGQHELEHVNGAITATDVSGTVVAHTTNGDVKVTLARIDAGKPMSFVSFNGDVDVTFPPGLAASLTMRSDNGEVFTDFDVVVQKAAPTKREDRSGGRYRVSVEKSMKATVGGGGPEITLRTFNGDIYLRKRG
jgi:hypothetical protein